LLAWPPAFALAAFLFFGEESQAMNLRRTFIGALVASLALGCGLTSSGPTVDRIESITIDPGRLALQRFQAADLAVVIGTSRGGPPDLASLQWSATGGTVSSGGIVNGVVHMTYSSPADTGTFYVTVTTVTGAPSGSASISVTATAVPVNGVAVSPGSASLATGDTTRLSARLTDSTGAVIVGRAIDWSTSDGAVASVLANGSVRAIGPGTATITASAEGKQGSAVITVKQ
jgi:hypothetical protein